MRLTRLFLGKRGWIRFPHEPAESNRLIRYGELKWRDYKSKYVEPPYWYKWTTESPYSPQEQNKILSGASIGWYLSNYKRLKIIPPDEWLYVVGDKVEILVGKDKGKQGEVTQVVPEGNIIVVGGLNFKRTIREDGIAYDIEQPLQHDEVSLVDPKSSEPVSILFKVNNDGKKVRVSQQSGHIIHWPPEKLSDGTATSEYMCGDKDTAYIHAIKRTYIPSMDPWEEELKKISGINDPPRKKTFWY